MARTSRLKKVHRQDFAGCLRDFFNPAAWRRLHQAGAAFEKKRSRWTLQPLLTVGLVMALSNARTRREQFEDGRELYEALHPRRRRCGDSVEGFLMALEQLPLAVLFALRIELQIYILRNRIDPSRVGRWRAFGLDGTKQNLPLTDGNLEYYGSATKKPPRPQRILAVAFGLATRTVWDWQAGKARDSERDLVLQVSRRLPDGALVVADAGMVGYEWVRAVRESRKHLLIRVGANCRLLSDQEWDVEWRDGKVWLWPKSKRNEAPLVLRLIQVKGLGRKRKGKRAGIWLLTDVMDPKELTLREARELYKMRWPANEVGFRVWKHVLQGEKAFSRTPEQAEREGTLSLLGMMLIQAQVEVAQKKQHAVRQHASVAKGAAAWRKAARHYAANRSTREFQKEMSEATVDTYQRKKPKVKRHWAERKDHSFATRPVVLKITEGVKIDGLQKLEVAGG